MQIYEGNKLGCGDCKFCPDQVIENGKIKILPCPTIDHSSIRLLKPLFNTAFDGVHHNNICNKFEPANWNLSVQNSWRGIEAYIEYMDKEYYDTPSFLEYNKLRDVMYVSLVTGEDIDRWGEYKYEVSLYEWLTGVAIKDGVIKYRYKYKIIRTPSGHPKGTEKISEFGEEKII